MATCNSCHATIRFVTIDGKAIPVNPTGTHHQGTIAGKTTGRSLTGYWLSKARPVEAGFLRYVPHRITCHPAEDRKLATERTPSLFDEDRRPTGRRNPTKGTAP